MLGLMKSRGRAHFRVTAFGRMETSSRSLDLPRMPMRAPRISAHSRYFEQPRFLA